MKTEALDRKNFTPDDTFEPEYPWEDVLACFDEKYHRTTLSFIIAVQSVA